MSVQIFFPTGDMMERGMITWEDGSWRIYSHESFARGWELAPWLENRGYEALLEHYKLDKSKMIKEDIIHYSPSELEKLSQSK